MTKCSNAVKIRQCLQTVSAQHHTPCRPASQLFMPLCARTTVKRRACDANIIASRPQASVDLMLTIDFRVDWYFADKCKYGEHSTHSTALHSDAVRRGYMERIILTAIIRNKSTNYELHTQPTICKTYSTPILQMECTNNAKIDANKGTNDRRTEIEADRASALNTCKAHGSRLWVDNSYTVESAMVFSLVRLIYNFIWLPLLESTKQAH